MSEIAGIREDSRVDRFELGDEAPAQETEKPVQIERPQAAPGESEAMMKAEESLQRAAVPNLRTLDRELEIEAQLEGVDSAKTCFSLAKELSKLKSNSSKKRGFLLGNWWKR